MQANKRTTHYSNEELTLRNNEALSISIVNGTKAINKLLEDKIIPTRTLSLCREATRQLAIKLDKVAGTMSAINLTSLTGLINKTHSKIDNGYNRQRSKKVKT